MEDDKAKVGGLLDPRMGTIDRNFKCQTCEENMTEWLKKIDLTLVPIFFLVLGILDTLS